MVGRIILHLDLDYFFAQVEEKRHEYYKDKPIVVCVYTDEAAGKGVVSTCNYIARSYGVHSGMPLFEARGKLAGKDALFLPGDYELYEKVSNGIFEIVSKYGDHYERASVDEFFIDITSQCRGDFEIAKEVAQSIKNEIIKKYGLTCSIGIAPNKLVSKIAAGMQKPNGLTIVTPDKMQSFLDELDVDLIPGIGKKTKEALASLGIVKIIDLRKVNSTLLVEKFGKLMAGWLYRSARGLDESEVGVYEEQKQISRIMTLRQRSRSLDEISPYLDRLIEEIITELNNKQLVCSTIVITAIDSAMVIHTAGHTLHHPTDKADDIRKTVQRLFSELIESTATEFRRIGIKVEKLESKKGQKTLGEF